MSKQEMLQSTNATTKFYGVIYSYTDYVMLPTTEWLQIFVVENFRIKPLILKN